MLIRTLASLAGGALGLLSATSVLAAESGAAPEADPVGRVQTSVGAGPAFVFAARNDVLGPGVHLQGTIGVQFTRAFGVSFQSGLNVFIAAYETSDTFESMRFYSVPCATLAMFTLADRVQLGIGPALDILVSEQSAPFDGDAAVAPGFDAHAGVVIPWMLRRDRRVGLELAVDFQPVFATRSDELSAILQTSFTGGVSWY